MPSIFCNFRVGNIFCFVLSLYNRQIGKQNRDLLTSGPDFQDDLALAVQFELRGAVAVQHLGKSGPLYTDLRNPHVVNLLNQLFIYRMVKIFLEDCWFECDMLKVLVHTKRS